MRYATQDNGNYGDDASLRGIEDATEEDDAGFGLPGQSQVGTVGHFRFADIGNEDENSTRLTALGDEPKDTIDLEGQPPVVSNEGLSSVSPGSLSTIIGANMSMNARIAYVMENGEPFCNHCEKTYFPGTRIACTNCGCNQPANDHGIGENNFSGESLTTVEGPTAGDLDAGRDIVKEEAKMGAAGAFYAMFKEANDSELYYQGYGDAQAGKPMDEDLALLSKDYYNGYTQYKFYNKTPQQSEGQSLYDIKPNSNLIPRSHDMTPGEADRGPLELTDGFGHATASKQAGMYDAAHMFMDRKDSQKDDTNNYHATLRDNHLNAANKLQGNTPWTGRTNSDGSPEFHGADTFHGNNPDHREAYFAHMDAAEAHGKAIATPGTGMNYNKAKNNADVASRAAWAKDPTNPPAARTSSIGLPVDVLEKFFRF